MKARAETPTAPLDAVDTQARVQWLYRRHRDEVYRLALRYGRGDPHWAEDVTQDVFVTLCAHIDRLDDWADLGRWFYRVTHNRCLSRMRRAALKDVLSLRWLRGRARDVDDTLQAEHRVGLKRVLEVVDALEPKQRMAFCMYYLDGLEQQEIGDMLGYSKSYVCKLIKRARGTIADAGWELDHG